MQQGWGLESYHDRRPFPWHARSECCRECRKEARSLLVVASAQDKRTQMPPGLAEFVSQQTLNTELQIGADTAVGVGTDFVGGECCVTLSVEYAATVATAPFLVAVLAVDSEGTILAWARVEKAGTSYRVHECIITTKPGAKLTVLAVNCSARVRWCEVFSC